MIHNLLDFITICRSSQLSEFFYANHLLLYLLPSFRQFYLYHTKPPTEIRNFFHSGTSIIFLLDLLPICALLQ
ncbi:unnamed protein product [Rhizophagus irregularis]|nr:unnamed protein product [Rhizophagus irregularis]